MVRFMMTDFDHHDPDLDLTLSERVARATKAGEFIDAGDGTYLIEMSVFPIDERSDLPPPSFDRGFRDWLRRKLGRSTTPPTRSVPRRRA